MKQILIIGSTVIDVLLKIPNLPSQGEDINIESSELRLGGCAFNVFKALEFFSVPALLCSPIGTGVYGRMVKEQLEAAGIEPFTLLDEENGCCYCLIEDGGERSFLSYHGAEYLFSRSWMTNIDYDNTDSIFICGLEVEESTGDEIVEFAFEHPELELYFAPGPRIAKIPGDRMERLLCRRDCLGKGPFLHLNDREACEYTKIDDYKGAAEYLAKKTANSLVITLGEEGAYILEKDEEEGLLIPPYKAPKVDKVGAGDAHCGAIIACLKKGLTLREACVEANKMGAIAGRLKTAIHRR